ncbi:lysophosphatidylcholine acyltransferase / lyso-PAF acetyltransferase [Schistosoma bovis]|uniref:Lysophosphatidylcholine acyltransferase / lyso-PAF acetyltransferase n=1 Tax=Schistosoma bovis TaxID=6184 RepID=A0A430Q192_SCHBO|nr:lysophosphatidylcholine acyltransferase / lyso-PAF acetyltransferase [Schistosoma bovis]
MGSSSKRERCDSQSLPERNSLNGDNIEHEGNILTPFTYECRASTLQYFKMYLLTVTILPFRALIIGFLFIATLLVANIFWIGHGSKSQVKPICDFRRWLILPIVRMSARLVFFAGGFHWIKIQGIRASRKEAPIMVIAPHSSFLDALVVVVLGLPSVVGKTESAESFVGGFVRMLQPILVNREDPNSRKKAIQELIRRAKSEEDWPQIVIFPEGTCTNRSCIATFKPGAFNAGVPVQPVIVRWPNKVFLPVYQPNEDEQMDAQLYANNIRRIMAESVHFLALEHNCDLITDEDKQAEWFQRRLESMLGVCRRKPYLSRMEFTQTLFQTSQPNSKANYLINLVVKYYSDPSSNNLNFRMCMVHTSMLLFPKLPHQAFYYATKAYNLCSSQSDVNMAKDWEISRSDAAELLGFAFTLENDETVNLILDRAYLIHKSTHSDNSSSGISGEYLYEGLLYHLPDVANCYAHFDAEINKVFGRHRRSLIDSTSTSESDLNDLKSTHSVPVVNSLNATSCPNITTISNKKTEILPSHFECIDVTEIPPIETNNYSEKLKDNVHLSSSPLRDDQSINFRGRYSERGM